MFIYTNALTSCRFPFEFVEMCVDLVWLGLLKRALFEDRWRSHPGRVPCCLNCWSVSRIRLDSGPLQNQQEIICLLYLRKTWLLGFHVFACMSPQPREQRGGRGNFGETFVHGCLHMWPSFFLWQFGNAGSPSCQQLQCGLGFWRILFLPKNFKQNFNASETVCDEFSR